MSGLHLLQSIFELAVIAFIVWGFFNEDKFICDVLGELRTQREGQAVERNRTVGLEIGQIFPGVHARVRPPRARDVGITF